MYRYVVFFLAFFVTFPAMATEAGRALLRDGGQAVLLNHAYAPGSGDPSSFDLDNCNTQRNLSERGRHQARRMGALLAARAAPVEHVYSSRYCRTMETAELVFGAAFVEEMEELDSLANNAEMEEEWSRAVIDLVESYTGSGNMFLVTHPENIEALTGVRPREGEAVIVAPGGSGLERIGRVLFN